MTREKGIATMLFVDLIAFSNVGIPQQDNDSRAP